MTIIKDIINQNKRLSKIAEVIAELIPTSIKSKKLKKLPMIYAHFSKRLANFLLHSLKDNLQGSTPPVSFTVAI